MSRRERDSETRGEAADGARDEGEASEDEPQALVRTTSCPRCGRRFVGRHCPGCGVPTGRPESILGVASTFFQELVDVRRGFWATLKALTRRPGSAVRQYLGAGPRLLMNPGRYLLAVIVVSFGTTRALTWLGLREGPADEVSISRDEIATGSSGPDAGKIADLITELVATLQQVFASQTYHVVSSIVLTGFLALLFWRLFRGRLRRGAQAVALAGFVVGHAVFLGTAARLLYVPTVHLASGTATQLPTFLATGVVVVWAAVTAWGAFGAGWTDALKGAGAALLASLEQVLAGTLVIGGYTLWVIYDRFGGAPSPEGTLTFSSQTGGVESEFTLAALWFGIVTAAPLLLHAGVEAYYHLRG